MHVSFIFPSLSCEGCCVAQVRSSFDNDIEVFGEAATGDVANERVLSDYRTGLNTTTFCVTDVQQVKRLAVKVAIELHCDAAATPWCVQ